jgi:glycerophosphoryl diester phosphodiesterase
MPQTPRAPKAHDLLCIGHRGAAGYVPENTLLSVQTALDLGAQAIEIDVYLVDGQLVVIHDDRLDRTTNGTGRVAEQSFEYLRSLDAGKGQKIPTLQEVIELVDRRAEIIVELKGPNTADPVVALVKSCSGSGTRRDDFLISSFDHYELEKARRLDPTLRRGPLVTGVPLGYARFAETLAAYSVHVSVEFLRPAFVEDAHRRGLKVFVFTVNHPDDVEQMRVLEVDGVITDFPDRVQANR